MKLTASSRGFFLAALIGAVAMGACSLNPQPIPPGEQAADGGKDFGGGTGLTDDASAAVDSGVTGNPAPGDGGDASDDGGDAATDEDASDAATDAGDE